MSLSFEEANELLRYDPETGKIAWRVNRRGRGARKAGDEAGCLVNGYRRIGIKGKRYLGHRIAWLLHYGEWPKQTIDHINFIKDDNRIGNLRDVSVAENARHMPPEWKEKNRKAIEKRSQSPEWRANVTRANREKARNKTTGQYQ